MTDQRRITIDHPARIARLDDEVIALTRTEFDLLSLLMAANGSVLSTRHLYEQVWGAPWFSSDHVVEVHVSRLRRKLGETASNSSFIETVRGIGYRYNDPRGPEPRHGIQAVTVTDTTQRIMWANDLVELVLDQPRQELVGRYLFELVSPGDADQWTQTWNSAVSGDSVEIRVRLPTQTRGVQEVGVELAGLIHPDGHPLAVVAQWNALDDMD